MRIKGWSEAGGEEGLRVLGKTKEGFNIRNKLS